VGSRRSGSRRTTRTTIGGLLASAALLLSATPALAATQIVETDEGPVTKFVVSDLLDCQLYFDGESQFYDTNDDPGSCTTSLLVGDTVYGNSDWVDEDYTVVGQDAPTGTGTADDPYIVETTVRAGTGDQVRIVQVDSYVEGDAFQRRDIVVTNEGGTGLAGLKLYANVDCQVGGTNDSSYGVLDAPAVACTANRDNDPAGDLVQFFPLSRDGIHYFQGDYWDDGYEIVEDGGDFADTCSCDTLEDAGLGLQWNFDLPAGASVVRSFLLSSALLETKPLVITKAADQAESEPGATNGYTISIENPNPYDIYLDAAVETLPAGFSYVPGSATVAGQPVDDPSVSGQTLTWTGVPIRRAATSSVSFKVKVASSEGTYANPSTTATAQGFPVTNASNTAPITVKAKPAPLPAEDGPGYRMVAADGGIFTFGDRLFHGSTGDRVLNKPIVGGATDVSDNDGYWIVASDGGVFTFNAPFFGSLGDQVLSSPAVEIEPLPNGKGYWIVLADGKVFTFGDANHFGDMSGKPLNQPIIGMTVTPSGRGYWLVAADGGIFNFGDAGFFGSMGDQKLNAPVIDLAPSVDNAGYYLLGRDGGVFTFGSADFKGSTGDLKLNAPVIAMLVAPNGAGYWLAASDGGVFTIGTVPFLGSMGDTKLNSPVLDLIY
jgi:uncharacterized repeat protein (TIGR01451 family)